MKAVARVVDTSSQDGANPQSSCVESRSPPGHVCTPSNARSCEVKRASARLFKSRKLPRRPPDGSTEVVKLPLLAIGDQRRSRRLELLDGLRDRRIIKRSRRGSVPSPQARMASISSTGRGMLPIGSVGMRMAWRSLAGRGTQLNREPNRVSETSGVTH